MHEEVRKHMSMLGKRAAANMTAAQRTERARKAVTTRWAKAKENGGCR
jgi:hypothetical protein